MTQTPDPIIVAVDGGGTGCTAAIGTRERGILVTARGGPSNVTTDIGSAISNVRTTVDRAAADAGINLADAIAHLALAGMLTNAQRVKIEAAMPFAQCTVTDDRPAAVLGALGDRRGGLLCIGTGSIMAHTDGTTLRYAGGWGFMLSDHGSGAWLGRAGLDIALRAHDRMTDHSDLTQAILAHFYHDPQNVVDFVQTAGPADYACFAPDIITAGAAGDFHGCTLMQLGAEYLADGLHAVGFSAGQTLCLTGGVGPAYAPYLPVATTAGLAPPIGTSIDGAFALAVQKAT